jgi:hypothetical protein
LEIQVRISLRHCVFVLFVLMLIVSCPVWGQVQNPSDAVDGEQNLQSSERSIEDLNLVGAETEMPPFSDSPIGIHSALRQALWDEGALLLVAYYSGHSRDLTNSLVASGHTVCGARRPRSPAVMRHAYAPDNT